MVKPIKNTREDHKRIVRPVLDCGPEVRTKSSMAEACDINRIMKRYHYKDIARIEAQNPGIYGDFSAVPDFMEANEIIIRANSQFEALPAKLRQRFGNDPAQFLAFVADPANKDEAKFLGLLKKDDSPESPVPGAAQDETPKAPDKGVAPAGKAGAPKAPKEPPKEPKGD